MANANPQRWVAQFERDAEADNYALFRSHLRRLNLPDEPELLMAGTVEVVIAAVAYANLDNKAITAFLKMQQYDPAKAVEAKYTFTFDLFGRAYGRVLIPAKATIPDLADLYGHPWEDYEVCGYQQLFVSRADKRKLGIREKVSLEKAITYDLRFDYCEDELAFWFDDASIDGVLIANVQDIES